MPVKRGFTLIEVLVVLALVVMIGGVSIGSGVRFLNKIQWDAAGGSLVHLLNRLTQLAQIEHTVVSVQFIQQQGTLRITSPDLKVSKKFEGLSIDSPSCLLEIYPEESSKKIFKLNFKNKTHELIFDDQNHRWFFKS